MPQSLLGWRSCSPFQKKQQTSARNALLNDIQMKLRLRIVSARCPLPATRYPQLTARRRRCLLACLSACCLLAARPVVRRLRVEFFTSSLEEKNGFRKKNGDKTRVFHAGRTRCHSSHFLTGMQVRNSPRQQSIPSCPLTIRRFICLNQQSAGLLGARDGVVRCAWIDIRVSRETLAGSARIAAYRIINTRDSKPNSS